jgi:cell division protein FtsW (lipid II flippase)
MKLNPKGFSIRQILRPQWRFYELALLLLVYVIAGIGFVSVAVAEQYRLGADPRPVIAPSLIPVVGIAAAFTAIHIALSIRKAAVEQFILPITALLFSIGMTMIWRLRGMDGVQQQIVRGLIPGAVIATALVAYPRLVEYLRRWAVPVGLGGLGLLFLTGVFGVQDETGARLSLKLGPLPAVQTSELIKVALIVFLAWYIEHEGRAAEGRAFTLWRFRLPAPRYLAPAALFVGAATLALVAMSDFGAVLILGALFVAMLFTGFQTRIFVTISALGLVMGLLVGLVLTQTWDIPATIRYRYLAFQNPWSTELMPNGYTIAEGPGYQIQQAVYAVIAGGVSGSGLGFGSPTFIPLAHSDFILAAIMEEMGSAVGIAVLALYAVLVMRLLRLSILLPRTQLFERLLLIGIGVHFFAQVFVMAGGTLNLIPLTGVTMPFLSQGGMALMVNLAEVGMALALMQRLGKGAA